VSTSALNCSLKLKMNTKKMPGESDTAFFIRNVLMASTAGMTAEVATIPIDTAKVRL